jgi:hypothetical protein
MIERVRHYTRYAVNMLAFVAAVLALPEFGQIVPADWLPGIAATAAALNTILSWLRPIVQGQ